MATTINVKGYDKPFTFPDGMTQAEIEAALRTIPSAPRSLPQEMGAIADTGVRGTITALPGLFGDTLTGQQPWQRKLLGNLAESLIPGELGKQAAQDLRTRKTPLTRKAPSDILQAGMETPVTEVGRAASSVLGGLVGSFSPGGQLSTRMKALQGIGSGGGAYVGEKMFGTPGAVIGGVVGGMAPSAVKRVTPDAHNLSAEVLHGVGDDQIDDVVRNMRWMEKQGIPINASQGATFASNLDDAVEHLTKKKQGQPLLDQLNAQPRQLQLAATDAVRKLPGNVLDEFDLNRSSQEAATGRLNTIRQAARTAWQKAAARNGGDKEAFSQTGMQNFAARLQEFADRPEHLNTDYQKMALNALNVLKHPIQPSGLPEIPGTQGGFNPFTGKRIPPTPGAPAQAAPVRYLEDPIAVRDALEHKIGEYEQLTQRSGSPDVKLKAKQEEIRQMYRELVAADTPRLQAANDAYGTVIRESLNPAKEGVVGYLAGARGALPGEQSPAKLLALFDRGTPYGAKTSPILTAERNLRGENPQAFPNAVKTWVSKKIGDLYDKAPDNRLPENLGAGLRHVFGNPTEPSAKWQTTVDMVAGSARSAKLDEHAVLKGFRDFVQSANMSSKRPGYMSMLDPKGIEQATGAAGLRNAGKINPFTPLKAPMYWTADRLEMSVLSEVAANLTSADGLLKLQQLARTRPESPVREALLRSLMGTAAATNAATNDR